MTARERLVRWVKRRPALAAVVGMSVLALVGLIVGLLVYNRDVGPGHAVTVIRFSAIKNS